MSTVFLARAEQASYEPAAVSEAAPELPGGKAVGAAQVLLRRLLADAGLDAVHYGSSRWNPLSDLIHPGDKVVIKPNWVYHENRSGAGMDCLVTHSSVISAVLQYAVAASPSQVVVGDAPIQGCDFPELLRRTGAEAWVRQFAEHTRIAIRDFRAKSRPGRKFTARSVRSNRCDRDYVEFDLGQASALEPITNARSEFRVTMYDPEALKRTHAPGMHRYLVAREIVEADVVFNVPKLKTHKKAGITGALKNAVGINGLKDYLPHHRIGCPETGGDCYERRSALKSLAESWLDAGNRSDCRPWAAAVLCGASKVSSRLDALAGGNRNLEGSWYGNDTIWRTVLDLQRILNFGKADGTLAATPQRRVIHLTDAIIAGEGEGPMYPTPVPLGVLTMSEDAAAAEWVHAFLMGFDPRKIALLQNAMDLSAPHSGGAPVSVCWQGKQMSCEELRGGAWPQFRPPEGWRRHCELEPAALEEAQLC
jgi:uncharacterized protein (DUF362 family)